MILQKSKSNQITFIVTSPQHKCLGEWNSYERAPDSAEKQQTIYIWTDSAKKTTDNLHMDRQCKKLHWSIYSAPDSAKKNNNSNLHMDRQCKKLHWSIYSAPDSAKKTTTAIYIWTDSAKNCTGAFTVLQTVQKKQQQQFTYGQTVQKTALEHLQCSRQCKKQQQQQQFTYGQTVQKSNSNLHMDSTYLQTVQKTMCKIHIHILSTHSVKTYLIINDTLYTVWAHLHYVQYLYIM